MPNNFRHIGLIHLILPNAKIIDARRGPMACCFSGFKQLFASGQQFTYGLQEIGAYYRNYVALMDHWDKVLPEKILRVQYEDVVEDLSTQVHRILDFCSCRNLISDELVYLDPLPHPHIVREEFFLGELYPNDPLKQHSYGNRRQFLGDHR